jgi:hypothetical protein
MDFMAANGCQHFKVQAGQAEQGQAGQAEQGEAGTSRAKQGARTTLHACQRQRSLSVAQDCQLEPL